MGHSVGLVLRFCDLHLMLLSGFVWICDKAGIGAAAEARIKSKIVAAHCTAMFM